jgi:hypothetical protein
MMILRENQKMRSEEKTRFMKMSKVELIGYIDELDEEIENLNRQLEKEDMSCQESLVITGTDSVLKND